MKLLNLVIIGTTLSLIACQPQDQGENTRQTGPEKAEKKIAREAKKLQAEMQEVFGRVDRQFDEINEKVSEWSKKKQDEISDEVAKLKQRWENLKGKSRSLGENAEGYQETLIKEAKRIGKELQELMERAKSEAKKNADPESEESDGSS